MYNKEELEDMIKCPVGVDVNNHCLGMKCKAFDTECDGSELARYTLKLVERLEELYKKENGWGSREFRKGEWEDICPSCMEMS